MQFNAKVFFPDLDLRAKIEDENLIAFLKGKLLLSECNFGESNLYKMEETSVLFDLQYDSDTVSLKQFNAETDGAGLKTSGKLVLSESMYTNLDFEVENATLGKLLKYIPDNIMQNYDIQNIDGVLDLSGNIKGLYSDEKMPLINFDYSFKKGYLETKTYPTLTKIVSEGKISSLDLNDLSIAKARLKKLNIETNNSSAKLVVQLNNFERPNYNLQSILNITLAEFADFIPDSLMQDVSGELNAEFSTSGKMPDLVDNKFINHVAYNSWGKLGITNLNFKMDTLLINGFSGIAEYNPGHLKLQDLSSSIPQWNLNLKNSSLETDFSGDVTNPGDMTLDIKSFNIEAEPGKIKGMAKIENLENPEFNFDGEAQIDLLKIKPYIPDSIVKSVSGEIHAKIKTHGAINYDSIEYQINNIVFNQSDICLEVRNTSATMPDTIQSISGLNGKFSLNEDNIIISGMSGSAANIDFKIDTADISNLYKTYFQNKKEDTLKAYIDINLGDINYAKIAPFPDADSTEIIENSSDDASDNNQTENNELTFWQPDFSFDFKGKIAVENIEYNKIFLDDISAKFHVSDSSYIIDQFITKAFDGRTTNSIRYDLTKENKTVIHLKNQVENMDINKLLFAFDDFGYDSLMSYKNLSGIFSSNINSRFVFVNDTLITHDMRVLGDFKLKNGKLVNYEPAMEISNFTGIKELDDIEMKTLNCDIFMFKNQVFVPITKIVSSSLDVSTFGMQSLDENYEYHLQLHLGDILKGKSQKLFERQAQSGEEVTDDDLSKSTIKLIYAYTDGKKRIGFATRKAQKKMELKIKVQQKMLELIFHPLLVSYETGVE